MENYHRYQGAGACMYTVLLKQQQAVEREAAERSLDERSLYNEANLPKNK